jgi:hypothetical protein
VSGLFGVLAHQATWTVIAIGIGYAMLEKGKRRLVVQGG